MQPKITFTGSTPADQTATGDASISITRNSDGSIKFETVVQTDVSEKVTEDKDLRGVFVIQK